LSFAAEIGNNNIHFTYSRREGGQGVLILRSDNQSNCSVPFFRVSVSLILPLNIKHTDQKAGRRQHSEFLMDHNT
jgi:hypothetical protein